MRKGTNIFTLYEEVVIFIYDFVPDPLNFQIYEENLFLFFISALYSTVSHSWNSYFWLLFPIGLCFQCMTYCPYYWLVVGLKQEGIVPVIINK
jgi:hypothetical protein